MFYYLLYKLGQLLALSLPLKLAYRLALILADMRYLFFIKEKRAVESNLKVILGRVDKKRLRYESRWVFRNFAKYLADFFRFSKLDRNFIDKFITVEGRNYLDRALSEGKGVILVTAHLGSWELGGAVVALLGYPLNVIALSHANKKVDNLFIRQRSSKGVKVVPLGFSIRNCFRALAQNEIVALLGDRDFSGRGLKMDFFGKKTVVPKGPAVFSIKSGAPIVPIFIIRENNDRFKLIFESKLNFSLTGNLNLDTGTITKEILAVLEKYIKRYPSQWFMVTNFWKE
jgi:lauroyl/myristoyl acyltransferase